MLIRPSRQRGMNIIELMIAIAIVALVMALAGPSARTWIQNVKLRNASEAVLSGVQNARVEALKRNTFVSFQLTDPASTAFTICLYDPVANACQPGAAAVLASKSANEASQNAGIGATSVVGTDVATALNAGDNIPAQVTFDSFGRLAPTAPNNILRMDVRNTTLTPAEERRLVILIGVGGQIRMCDPLLPKAANPQGCV